MDARLVRLLACSALWALCACGDKPSEVELRLYPCALVGGVPMSVGLEIQSLDAKGAKVGELLTRTFPIDDPGVFDDDYATVGFKPPAGTVKADIKVTWERGGEQVFALYLVAVPGLGESVELGVDDCEGGPGTTTETPTTTSDPSTTDTGTGTTGATTGTGTDSDTGTTGTTATTGTTTTTTETTTDTTDTTTTGTSTTTTTTTTTTTDTTDTTDTDTTTGTTGGPVEGQPCDVGLGVADCDGGPGKLGQLLFCDGNVWTVDDPKPEEFKSCKVDACADLPFESPQVVGCLGQGEVWSCACAENPVSECTMSQMSECAGPLGGGIQVDLCVAEGDKTLYYAGICNGCEDSPDGPICKYR